MLLWNLGDDFNYNTHVSTFLSLICVRVWTVKGWWGGWWHVCHCPRCRPPQTSIPVCFMEEKREEEGMKRKWREEEGISNGLFVFPNFARRGKEGRQLKNRVFSSIAELLASSQRKLGGRKRGKRWGRGLSACQLRSLPSSSRALPSEWRRSSLPLRWKQTSLVEGCCRGHAWYSLCWPSCLLTTLFMRFGPYSLPLSLRVDHSVFLSLYNL